jgi:hypothetical protein
VLSPPCDGMRNSRSPALRLPGMPTVCRARPSTARRLVGLPVGYVSRIVDVVQSTAPNSTTDETCTTVHQRQMASTRNSSTHTK